MEVFDDRASAIREQKALPCSISVEMNVQEALLRACEMNLENVVQPRMDTDANNLQKDIRSSSG